MTLSLRRQILLTIAMIAGLLLLLFVASSYLGDHVRDASQAREHNAAATRAALGVRYHIVQIQQFLTDVSATGDDDGLHDAETHLQAAEQRLQELATLMPERTSEFDTIHTALRTMYQTGVTMAQAYLRGGREAGNALMKAPETGFDARSDALGERFEPMLQTLEQNDHTLAASVEDTERFAGQLLLGIELLILVICLLALWRLYHQIFQALGGEPRLAQQITQAIAGGDLSISMQHPPPAGSLLAAMGDMRTRLQRFAHDAKDSATSLDAVAHSLGGTAGEVSASAHQVSSSCQSMSETIAGLSQQLDKVAEHADEAHQASRSSGQIAHDSGQVIRNASDEIQRIDAVTQTASTQLGALEQESRRISSIVAVIKEVADQTNLLALNAAIEAARAGESGRGFAVVADEVRKLAERTAQSTQEIEAMVEAINTAAESAIAAMGAVHEHVTDGANLARDAGEAIVRIIACAEQVDQVVSSINAALHEQTAAHAHMRQQMELLADEAEQNSAHARELSSHADGVREESGRLQENVAWFQL